MNVVVNKNKIVNIVCSFSTEKKTFYKDDEGNVYSENQIDTAEHFHNYLIYWLYYDKLDKPSHIPSLYMYNIHNIKCTITDEKILFNIILSKPAYFIGEKGKVFNWYMKMLQKKTTIPIEINLHESEPISNIENVFKNLNNSINKF